MTFPITNDADSKRKAIKSLSAPATPLFAVLDAARSGQVLSFLCGAKEEFQSLYEGPEAKQLSTVAPYLVSLTSGSKTLERMVNQGWGQSWGIYLSCPLPFTELRRHLRHFLFVESEETREQLYFRFYDPRVLRVFLSSCTPQQWKEFFGQIECFWAESSERTLTEFPRSMKKG